MIDILPQECIYLILDYLFDKSIFSDGSKGKEPFVKEECQECGTVRTKSKFN